MGKYVILISDGAMIAGHGSLGEGKGRGLVSLGTCLLWTRIYTPRGPEASADYAMPPLD